MHPPAIGKSRTMGLSIKYLARELKAHDVHNNYVPPFLIQRRDGQFWRNPFLRIYYILQIDLLKKSVKSSSQSDYGSFGYPQELWASSASMQI